MNSILNAVANLRSSICTSLRTGTQSVTVHLPVILGKMFLIVYLLITKGSLCVAVEIM